MNILEKVYNPDSFRELGHQLIDLLADELTKNVAQTTDKVIDYIDPDDNYDQWTKIHFDHPIDYFRKIIENSIRLAHPKYTGHQVCSPAPLASLAGFEGLFLNSGGALYEMSGASSTLEKRVIDIFKDYFGLSDGDGILTSGGTLANLTALICARNIKAKNNIWKDGNQDRYAFMISSEAHYCIDRAVRVMGWGDDGIIKVPVTERYCMNTSLLQEYYDKAIASGITILGVVGSAPSTSTGIYDDLISIGEFCQKYDLWFHIDAAHGGPAAFSKRYKGLMNGSHMANSITVDAHKMMMTPSLTTMLFFKNSSDSYKTFAQQAMYLWGDNNEEWYNYGKRTMECTKIMLSVRVYALYLFYGMSLFETYLDHCYDLARRFVDLLNQYHNIEIPVYPDSNIVCFRITHSSNEQANKLNAEIRQKLLAEGKFYIVQTTLSGNIYLRITIINVLTTENDLKQLIEEIMRLVSDH